ncbi:MAG TPA: carboxypeptidase-like regulatory domain-containing protein [Solirubrobacterales bacterium]|nr:carboxypeptidase-like regulatory domain-containing protein [Solirubrobacterales bacterium]
MTAWPARFRFGHALALVVVGLVLAGAPAGASAAELSGTVQGQQGGGSAQPLVGAEVEVFAPTSGTLVASAVTDGTGEYEVEVGVGTYDVRVTPPSGTPFQPTSQKGLQLDGDKRLNFVLVPAGRVRFSGTLRDASGSPVAGYLSLFNQDDPSQSIENQRTSSGAFSFAVAPGRYRIYLQSGSNSNPGLPERWSIWTQTIQLNEDRSQDLTLPKAVSLTVHVTDPAGGGIPAIVRTGSAPMSDIDLGGGIRSDSGQSGYGFPHPTDSQGNVSLLFFPSDQPVPGQGLATPTGGDYAPVHFDIPVLDGDTLIHISLQSTTADTVPPALVGCDSPDEQWHPDNLTLFCRYEDLVSGEIAVALTTAVSAGEETENAEASANGAAACDSAGNCAEPPLDIPGNKIDRLAPEISITSPVDGSAFALNEAVAAAYGCIDQGSGVAACDGTVANGALVTDSVGSHALGITATDQVGNSSSSTASYAVRYSTAKCMGSSSHAVLPPLKADGSSKYQRGQVVSVQFRVCDANGNPVGTPGVVAGGGAPILVGKSNGPGGADEAVISASGRAGFSWNPSKKTWEFDQSTSNLVPGVSYSYRIDLNDGSSIEYGFEIRNNGPNN